VGKILGPDYAMKGGVGTTSRMLDDGLIVGALTVVNALGDIIDHNTGAIIAGAKDPETGAFLDTVRLMAEEYDRTILARMNTTLSVVATNASLTKAETNKVAQMAHNGLARTIRPSHTMVDGDTIFALALGHHTADVSRVGAIAAEVVADSVVQAATVANNNPDTSL
jgi:L-aminopeptidase/D-esterase-like protein